MKEFKNLFQMKRILTFVLAIAMVVTMFPTSAYAAQMPQANLEQNEVTAAADETATPKANLTLHVKKTAVYNGNEIFKDLSDEQKGKISLDSEDQSVSWNDLTFKWSKVKEDGTLSDLSAGETPKDAGKYQLSVKKDAYSLLTEIFTITPAQLVVTPDVTPSFDSVKAGTKVGDFKLSDGSWDGFSFSQDDPENSHLKITFTIRDAFDADRNALAADTVLVSNGDYVVDFKAEFTEKGKSEANGNYEIAEIPSKDVTMSDKTPTFITVTYGKEWEEESTIVRTYTGNAISVSDNDFTAKVEYEVFDSEKNDFVYKEVPGAVLEGAWYEKVTEDIYADEDKNTSLEGETTTISDWVQMESAPVNAGDYRYRLSYKGLDGVYSETTRDVRVVIEPKQVVLVPELKADAVFYEGMNAADVLSQIDYKVYAADDTTLATELEVDRGTVWGTSYFVNEGIYKTQPYEPVFVLQEASGHRNENGEFVPNKDEKENIIFYEVNNNRELEAGRIYRVIFSGNKAVEVNQSYEMYKIGINEKPEPTTADLNYSVSEDPEIWAKHVVTSFEIKSTTKPEIKIDQIIEGLAGKGDSLNNVATKYYDGQPFYAKKEDYKKAVVMVGETKLAENYASVIDYKWYKNSNDSITDNKFDDYTNEPYGEGENKFDSLDSWGAYSYSVPTSAGVYKLEITYKDPKKPEYGTATTNVYYVIEKQPIRVKLEGTYSALTGQRIGEFLSKLDNEETGALTFEKPSTISGNTWVTMTDDEKEKLGEYDKNWFIRYKILETKLKEDSEEVQKTDSYHYCYRDDKGYYVYDDQGVLIEEDVVYEYDCYDNYAVFKKDARYQLIAEFDQPYNNVNYTDEKFVINNYRIDKDDKTKVHEVRELESLEVGVPVTVDEMGTTKLNIDVVEENLGTKEKVYDGEDFDVEDILGTGVSIKKEDGTVVTDVELEYTFNSSEDGDLKEIIHAGEYTLKLSYAGDRTYAPTSTVIDGIKIKKANITVTPVISESVVAGTGHLDVWNSAKFQQSLVFDGVVEVDKDAFTYDIVKKGFKAYADNTDYDYGYDYGPVRFTTIDEEGQPVNYYLKGEKTYTIKDSGTNQLKSPYDRDYEVEYKEATYTTVRGTSTVKGTDANLTYYYFTNDVKDDRVMVAVNDAVDGLKHTIVPINAIPYSYYEAGNIYGNFLAVRIRIPKEYYGIPSTAMYKNAIKAQGGIIVNERNIYSYIDVLLDASLVPEVEGKKVTSFDIRWEDGYVETFSFDFTKADLMGNLADAVAPKSIAFNTPATKMAVGEVQDLDLKLTKVQFNDVVCISYTVDKEDILSVDEFGAVTALKKGSATVTATPVKLENGKKVDIKDAKAAKVKITVTDVAKPKIKKVTAYDDSAFVIIDKIANGYRREVYVLEGKNIKPADFEKKIENMKQLQWEGIFVNEPIFMTHKYEEEGYIWGLSSNKDYTVYVRNVSAVRKAGNGNNVELSIAGVTKSFKTTKAQVQALSMTLKDVEKVDEIYTVELSKGKVSTEVIGGFRAKEADPAADNELRYEKLPLSAALKKTYEDPKLNYAVYNKYWSDYNNEYMYVNTDIASIDKKGNIKLAGVGTVYVHVWNSRCSSEIRLDITATPTKVKANNKKLKIGEGIYLEELLTYYEGNKKLIGNFDRKVIIDDALRAKFAENDAFELDEDGYVTAVKEGGKLQVELTDYYIAKIEGGTPKATVTLTTTPLEAVKNLKIADAKALELKEASLADNYAKVMFTYKGNTTGFKIEITDARGRLIRSSYVQKSALDQEKIAKGKSSELYYIYEIEKLTQQSKYNVTVTPRYYDASAKSAKLSFTTTKIPASTWRAEDNEGEKIYLPSSLYNDNIRDFAFTSGNTYSLKLDGNSLAEAMGYDSLTWSSSNKKVVTVKGISGSYYANLKALRAGSTTITVKSKITKEVIASWDISVQTVGDGYSKGRRYFDENVSEVIDTYVQRLTLGSGKRVDFIYGTTRVLKFVAPHDGEYDFFSNETYGDPMVDVFINGSYEDNFDDSEGYDFRTCLDLYYGDEVTLYVTGYSPGTATIRVIEHN